MYIYEKKDWPDFHWDENEINSLLISVRHHQGRFLGKMENLGFTIRKEAILESVAAELINTNAIEDEKLDADQVRSSLARQLGLDKAGLVPSSRNVDALVEVMIDAAHNCMEKLTEDRLFKWHKLLFLPKGKKFLRIKPGAWRTKINQPMQVISGSIGKEKIHFVAPGSAKVPKEMKAFLNWFNSNADLDPLLKASIAHLWFVTIHPFEDGNGRIARAIADLQLARADGITQRFYSMSAQIMITRKSYYDILEQTQKGSLDITNWIRWFLNCFDESLLLSDRILAKVIAKSDYWQMLNDTAINQRQKLMINKLLDGFVGKLSSSKWASICKCSQDTALRDIQGLLDIGVLEKEPGGGRSTSYYLKDLAKA